MRYENITRKNRARRSGKGRGQALAEYALVTPLILFVSMGIIDFGRALFSYAQASFQIRTALRTGGITETNAGVEAFKDCNALAAVVKKTLFIPASAHSLKIRFIKQTEATPPPADPTNPGYITCYDDTQSPNPPASWTTDQDNIVQGDLIEVNDQISVQLITPFFPETLKFTMIGRRTVVTAISLPSAPGDSDFDGLDDLWECDNFDTVGIICDVEDASFDKVAFDAMLAGQNAADDPDGDGCNNGCEEGRKGDPNNPDTDGDTLLDGAEAYTYFTDLFLADTDGDDVAHMGDPEYDGSCTMNDNDELALGTDPLTPDTDFDGVDDWLEVCVFGTDPLGAPSIDKPTLEYWPGGSACDPATTPAADDRYIGLDWTTLTGIEGYWVELFSPPSTYTPLAKIEDPATSQCGGAIGACSSLFSGWSSTDTTYQYVVRGYFGSVLGPRSDPISLSCTFTALTAVTDLTQRIEGSGSSCLSSAGPTRYQGLSWTASGATGYYIYANGTRVGDVNTNQCGDAPSPGSCFNLDSTSWDPDASISYEIVAHNGDILASPSASLLLACNNP